MKGDVTPGVTVSMCKAGLREDLCTTSAGGDGQQPSFEKNLLEK